MGAALQQAMARCPLRLFWTHGAKKPPTSSPAYAASPSHLNFIILASTPCSLTFSLLPEPFTPLRALLRETELAMPLSLFLLLWGLMVEIEADCYSRDGIAALHSGFYGGPELISCGNGTTNCCLADQRCGTNLLCTDLNGGISRQYCDNPNWHGCSNMCPGMSP